MHTKSQIWELNSHGLDRELIINYQYTVSSAQTSARPRGAVDAAGVFLSQLCLLHCFLLPALLAVLPSLDFHSLPGGEAIHFGILTLSTPTAIYALLVGRRYHHLNRPMLLGIVGLALLWLGTALEHGHHGASHFEAHLMGACGSFFLLAAHLTNWRASRKTHSCPCPHPH